MTLDLLSPSSPGAVWIYILVAGVLANEIWRWLGVAFAGRLTEDMEVFRWVRAVATALVAAVITQLVLFPTGALAAVPLAVRVTAFALGVGVSLAVPRVGLLGGVVVAEALLIAGAIAFG